MVLCLSFFSLSVYRGSWLMCVVAWHCTIITIAVYLVRRSCLCGSFVTTELISLWDEESARALGVLNADE